MTTEVERGEGAIVTANDMTEINLLVPDEYDDDAEMPQAMQYLFACAMRYYDDPQFVAEMLSWLERTIEGRRQH